MNDTRSYLQDLQALVSEQSEQGRDVVLARVTDLFFATADQQRDADLEIFGDAMERLAFALETGVRAQLSQRLAPLGKAPKNLIRRLAADEIEVASPVLKQSPCLSDEDLIGIARSSGQEYLRAISGRKTLSTLVTDVIVERGDDDILAGIAGNDGAKFSSESLRRMTERASHNPPLLSALDLRVDLPPHAVEQVKRAVAQRLKRDMADQKSKVQETDIDWLVDTEAENLRPAAPEKRAPSLPLLRGRSRITEEMLIGFSKSRLVPETIHCLAALSGLDNRIAAHCLLKADLAVLAVVCRACGFDNSTFCNLIRFRTKKQPLNGKEVAEAGRYYNALSKRNADQMLLAVKERFASQQELPTDQPTA